MFWILSAKYMVYLREYKRREVYFHGSTISFAYSMDLVYKQPEAVIVSQTLVADGIQAARGLDNFPDTCD